MGRRIESVTSREFDALFTSFEHTAYRLETLQVYDVSYEVEPYQAFISGHPQPHDPAKNAWVSMIKDAVQAGKIFQRVRIVTEPLTDYLRYELGWSYPPNVDVGEDIRILPTSQADGRPCRGTTTGYSIPATCGSWNMPMTARSGGSNRSTPLP